MLPAPRVIVIDDNLIHLRALADGLNRYGAACLEIHFSGDVTGIRPCKDVRVIFADLHLNEGGAGADNERHFGVIGGLLEESFKPAGPYVLILWTRFADQADALRAFLDARLNGTKPLAVVPLDKTQFLDAGDSVRDPAALVDAIATVLRTQPQLAALLNWEGRVLEADADTVAAILTLAASAAGAEGQGPELARLLARLAAEAVGQGNVERDRFAAVNEALLPILADRIAFLPRVDADVAMWEQAYNADAAKAAMSLDEAAQLNRLLHVAEGVGGATDRGSVVLLSDVMKLDSFADIFGMSQEDAASGQYRAKEFKTIDGRFKWVAVQAQAACDHAQRHPGPLPFLLGLVLPCAMSSKDTLGALWRSPPLKLDGGSCFLHINCRFPISVPQDVAAMIRSQFRLRDQLLADLIHAVHSHGARPGTISFRLVAAKPAAAT